MAVAGSLIVFGSCRFGVGGLPYDNIGLTGLAAGMLGMGCIAGKSIIFGGGLNDSFSSSSWSLFIHLLFCSSQIIWEKCSRLFRDVLGICFVNDYLRSDLCRPAISFDFLV